MPLEQLPSFGQIIRHAMALDAEIYLAVQQAQRGLWIALAVVVLAGLSQAVGQSLVLFLNRIRPLRFVLAVVISALSYTVGYISWTVIVWAVGAYGFGRDVPMVAVAIVVGLAYAPQLLAFFELTPFFGNPFGILLSLWSMVAVVVAVRAGLNLEIWQAIVASGTGWLLIQIWRRTLGQPIYALGQLLEKSAAGVPLQYTMQDLPQMRRQPQWGARHSTEHRNEKRIDGAEP